MRYTFKRYILSLVTIGMVVVLVGCPVQKGMEKNQVDYASLFEQAMGSDGAEGESIAAALAEAYEANPDGFLSAMAQCPTQQIKASAALLVYGQSYGDLDAFAQDIQQRLNASTQSDLVLNAIIQAIDAYNTANPSGQQTDNAQPDPSQYDVEKLRCFATEHDYTSGADEEFFSLLADVYRKEPETLLKAVEGLSDNQIDYIARGIAYDIINHDQYEPCKTLDLDHPVIATVEAAIADKRNGDLSSFEH